MGTTRATAHSPSAEPKGEIVVGVSGAFAENQVVAEMYAQVLEADGYTVTRELDIADRAVGNEALAAGEIDLKPEYTGFDLPLYDETGDRRTAIRKRSPTRSPRRSSPRDW